jgi:NADH-ubiquinone oxidoreductase chain 3
MHKPYKEKQSEFECGFHSFLGQNRSQFSISFFLFGLLFLISDLEIVLIYPYVVSAYGNSSYGLTVVFIFLLILTAGFVFEIGKKALSINSKQPNNFSNIPIDSIQSISLSNISLKSSKRNYQTKILSNQINRQIRSLSTTRVVQQDNSQHLKFNPWYITKIPLATPVGMLFNYYT